jgi:hypothetical protein
VIVKKKEEKGGISNLLSQKLFSKDGFYTET